MKHARLPRLPYTALVAADTVLDPARPVTLPLPQGETFDAYHTFRCGQIFRWRQEGDTWYGPHAGGSLAVRPTPEGLEVRALGVKVTAADAWRFLNLDHPLVRTYAAFASDPRLSGATAAAGGMRVLRQDPWECLTGYICSQNSNIPKIELSLERIARLSGRVLRWPEGVEVAAFPRPEALAAVSLDALRATALGYRCGYLSRTAQLVAGGEIEPDALRALSYDQALEALLALPGVGRKVADCILVFSMDKGEACPVDVWVRRVIHELYPRALAPYLPDARTRIDGPLSGREYEAIVRFARDRWGRLAGYAQQYLFHARRQGFIGPGR